MDGPPPQEEDFSTLSIEDRLAHKNWKARVSAYESLIKTFQLTASETDPAFKPYLTNPDILKKIVTDSNAVAQEKGVEAVVAFVKFAGENSARTREAVVPSLVDKCFGSARAGTKNQATELVLQYVEVENGGAGVVENVLPGLGAKQPKIVAGTVVVLKEIVRQFGTQVTPPASILKSLPKIFGHSDKTVRAEGTNLTHAFYQYLGAGIEPWLADLKPVQVKELKEAWEVMEKDGKGKGSLKPERMTRQHAREVEENAEAGDDAPEDDAGEEDLAPPDPRQFAEEVDIVPKLPSGLQTNLTSSKWKERKEALDDLLTLLNATPRIKEASEIGELAKSLATRVQADANINCVMVAAQCMEALAKGMMSSFARYRETVVPPMLERLKERKANVTDTIGAALDAVFQTTTLADIIGDILPALTNKNPQVKEGTLKLLHRCLATSPHPIPPPQVKPVSEALASLLEDSFAGARDEAAIALGTLMKMVGERPMGAIMDALADVRKVKVKEAYEKATVKAKAGSGAPPKSAAPTAKEPPKKKAPAAAPKKKVEPAVESSPPAAEPDVPVPEKKPAKGPPARLLSKKAPGAAGPAGAPPAAAAPAKKPVAAAAAAAAASKPAKSGAPAPPGALDTFKYKHTPEDAEALAADLIPPSIATDFADANWKTRLAALEEMTTWIEGAVEEVDAEVVVRFLAKKGWNEKNFQVSAKLYNILVILAERCPSFGRSCPALCVPHLSEKLGDIKLKKPAGEALVAFSERTSLQFVLNQAYDPMGKIKAPKALADALGWIESALTEFGIAGLSLRSLIDFLKSALKNSNAAVRTSATKTLVTVKLFAGAGIKDLLEDLNPQLLGTIQTEFDKVEGQSPPEPVRTSAEVAAAAPQAGTGSKGGAAAGDPLDDLFPRVEIDGLLKGTTILADAKSDAWKTKKEALETLQAILDQGSNKRLKPQMGDIGQVLKARVTDSNKAVQTLALDIVARIATGMGKPFDKQTRFFVVPVATVLADQKAPIRSAALQTLTAIAAACEGMDALVHGLTTALEANNPVQRATLLGWMVEWFKEHDGASNLDLSGWTGSIISCLDDRNGDVRKGAQGMLPFLISSVGFDQVMHQTGSLKPASKASAVPLIMAARTAAAPPASAPAPPNPPKAAAPAKAAKPPSPPAPSPPPQSSTTVAGPSAVPVPPSRLGGIRRKLPQGTVSRPDSVAENVDDIPPAPPASRMLAKPGLKRPGAAAAPAKPVPAPAPIASTVSSSLPLYGTNLDAKKLRLSKDAVKWVNEAGTTRKDLAELLQHQMEPYASKDLLSNLFSHDHSAVNDHVAGLTTLSDFYSDLQAGEDRLGLADDDAKTVGIANSDLALKYVSIKAHEPQSNLISKCLDVVDSVLSFMRSIDYQLTDPEALSFIPTLVYKLGDAREPVRTRVQQIFQTLPKVYAYSRVFQILLDYGLKSKVAKTRQLSLDELAGILKRSGSTAFDQNKACPTIAAMIADKDLSVRKSALSALSEVYVMVGEKIWNLVGPLSPKDKTQLEERLRRVPGPSTPDKREFPPQQTLQPSQISRLTSGLARPGSPSMRPGGIPRPASPSVAGASRLARPASPFVAPATVRSMSPAPSQLARPGSQLPGPTSPRGKTMLPSRLAPPRPRAGTLRSNVPSATAQEVPDQRQTNIASSRAGNIESWRHAEALQEADIPQTPASDITLTISSILSSDSDRSVDALKKIQKVLQLGPEDGPSSSAYRDLAEHTEGLVETVTLQMAHAFDHPADNIRLAKHLIQTLNAFCDNPLLAESLTVDILTALLEELALRLLQTDDSPDKEVKNLSRFINMIMLRLFSTGRRITVFRSLFALLLQIVKPFPSNGTLPDSQEAKVAELVLKCIWKLARNIPQDLSEVKLDPVELFPAVEHFLQSVPPNEWRARATNRVPCGDMPLRTVKVIIQHVVAHYAEDVYDILSGSFDDPSATIVYPYVYRILNSSSRAAEGQPVRNGVSNGKYTNGSPASISSRPNSPHETASSATSAADVRRSSPSRQTSRSASSINGLLSPPVEEPDPDAQLILIIGHISSETTGAMHKEGITELHHFMKAYPHKKPKVDKMLEATGPAFRKYISRALASRAAEDEERDVAVADTLSKLESNAQEPLPPTSPARSRFDDLPRSPVGTSVASGSDRTSQEKQDKLSRLHDIFQYRTSTISASSHGRATPSLRSPPAV
ncbi:ARM repeat-containing protein [Artomyces pyxidatus]|uniref:ARM repeat-containing protein n=1 Tax=Artomyces pyxidatus TaxID=48021 RepID=A0ACB8T7S5_9AGAM|nr:ARM repeat-containing protein [Artomyces pyxidatus]